MASNKNQHFVPRCYLRPFTIGENGVAINLYNIDRQNLIQMAPVKSQCSGNYFYGKDELLEEIIQNIEGEYATILRAIVAPGYRLSDEHRNFLKTFWLFQYLRTESASIRAVEMHEGFRSVAGVEETSFRMEIRDAVQIAMKIFADQTDQSISVSDLKVCLLKNKTQVPFVTSDDPAILTNRWYMQSQRARDMSFGLAAAGNILIMPLTPRVLCLGYDGDVYSVLHENGWVDVRSELDVEALNQHQFLNCRANIFVNSSTYAEFVHASFLRAQSQRTGERHRIHYAVRSEDEERNEIYAVVNSATTVEHNNALIHVQAIHPTPSFWPKQLAWRNKGHVFSNGSAIGYVRSRFTSIVSGRRFDKIGLRE